MLSMLTFLKKKKNKIMGYLVECKVANLFSTPITTFSLFGCITTSTQIGIKNGGDYKIDKSQNIKRKKKRDLRENFLLRKKLRAKK